MSLSTLQPQRQHRPYQIAVGDDQTIEDPLTDRMGRVIDLSPYDSVTVQLEREGTRLTLDGAISDEETVAVDLAGRVDQTGEWALEWELSGPDHLRTVPAEGTIPLIARRPLTGYDLLVASTETYTIASGDREVYGTTTIEQGGVLIQEQGSELETTGD